MKFRVFRVLFGRRMWLESFLCLKGRSSMSSELSGPGRSGRKSCMPSSASTL